MAANIEDDDTMAKKTPLQIVKETYGSKDALVDKVAAQVEREEGESEADHKKRLKYVSNAKLLHLAAQADKLAELGGRDGLVAKILEIKSQAKDHEFADKLRKTSVGRLLDMLASLQRNAANQAKKAG